MKRRTVLFEDATMAYNKWTQGIASREQSAQRVGFDTILGGKSGQELDNRTKKKAKLLHHTLDKTTDIVGDIILNLSNLKQKVNLALDSNLAQDATKKEILIALRKKINTHLKQTQKLALFFDKLS